ncbi:GFA family protein [Anaeromyxobacter oryzae]|uniref:Aldehyde-activating protein n=1 Tax=Anaeromyxobacter oryzae TaxID=2918170 RepID=A0ABM7WPH5_9BACT|nr:GFA family protein [Anaeromyxobacter oryzae]BDG01366.1 aldehyde-activating protein [Anaeromyxobacter oryzae]
MAEAKTYTGGCHCGAVRYRVTADLDGALACNCSICQKTGTALTFVPTERFDLLAGADHLTDYQFGKKAIHHLFCDRCGIRSFSRGRGPDGREMIAVNVRCLDGIDLAAVPIRSFDGRSLPVDG